MRLIRRLAYLLRFEDAGIRSPRRDGDASQSRRRRSATAWSLPCRRRQRRAARDGQRHVHARGSTRRLDRAGPRGRVEGLALRMARARAVAVVRYRRNRVARFRHRREHRDFQHHARRAARASAGSGGKRARAASAQPGRKRRRRRILDSGVRRACRRSHVAYDVHVVIGIHRDRRCRGRRVCRGRGRKLLRARGNYRATRSRSGP